MPKQGHGYIGGDRRPDTTTLGELGESGLVKEGAVGGTTFTATTATTTATATATTEVVLAVARGEAAAATATTTATTATTAGLGRVLVPLLDALSGGQGIDEVREVDLLGSLPGAGLVLGLVLVLRLLAHGAEEVGGLLLLVDRGHALAPLLVVVGDLADLALDVVLGDGGGLLGLQGGGGERKEGVRGRREWARASAAVISGVGRGGRQWRCDGAARGVGLSDKRRVVGGTHARTWYSASVMVVSSSSGTSSTASTTSTGASVASGSAATGAASTSTCVSAVASPQL
jgi:hypothetical protein